MERYNAVVGQYQTAVLICRNQLADGANMMRTEPLSTEAGDTTVADDSYAAAQQIAALVAEQRARASTLTTSQLYDAVYADPNNNALLARAHRRSSTSGDELQR